MGSNSEGGWYCEEFEENPNVYFNPETGHTGMVDGAIRLELRWRQSPLILEQELSCYSSW